MPAANRNFLTQGWGHVERIHEHLERQTELLEKAIEHGYVEAEVSEFFWLRNNAVSNAAGTGVIELENRTGYEIELISYSAQLAAASAGTTTVLFYYNSIEPQNLIWTSGSFGFAVSDKFTRGMIVPVNGKIIAQILLGGNAVQGFANVLARSQPRAQEPPYPARPFGF